MDKYAIVATYMALKYVASDMVRRGRGMLERNAQLLAWCTFISQPLVNVTTNFPYLALSLIYLTLHEQQRQPKPISAVDSSCSHP